MNSLYLSKSNHASAQQVILINNLFSKFTIKQFSGGVYSVQPIKTCDVLILCPPFPFLSSGDHTILVGKGVATEIQVALGEKIPVYFTIKEDLEHMESTHFYNVKDLVMGPGTNWATNTHKIVYSPEPFLVHYFDDSFNFRPKDLTESDIKITQTTLPPYV